MNRRSIGRGRLITGAGAFLILVSGLFPWGQTAGIGLPPIKTGMFDGFGILVFISAVGLLALVALPYAAGDQPVGIDRPIVFALLAGLGVVGFVLKLLQIAGDGLLALPDRALGLWLAGIGLGVVIWGVAEIAAEQRAT